MGQAAPHSGGVPGVDDIVLVGSGALIGGVVIGAEGFFGAHRFKVDDGPRSIVGGDGPMAAHSNYFNPTKDKESATNIALIVAGHAQDTSTEEPR
ncbi:hypothetical protein [Streptomyces sp. NPDC005533]|uniref:hypothetical protein n=1 Tax=Streptomyces sp. NPDC005533 TaxID=3364723 RepID=UPI0036938FE4